MTQSIHDLIQSMPLRAAVSQVAPYAPPVDQSEHVNDRIWPAELAAILANNPRSVPLIVDGPATVCWNCGGFGSMMVYTWTAGPFQSPNGQKVKWLLGGVPSGWYQGETHYAFCPRCHGDTWKEYLRANCGLEDRELNISIENFKAGGPYFEKEAPLILARSLLAMNDKPCGFVTYWGEPGRGKSHLLKSLVNGFRNIGVYAKYVVAADMIQSILKNFSDGNGNVAVEEAIQQYRNITVLAIDELDQVKETDWVLQTFHRLLNKRYEQSNMLTLIAMKKSPDELSESLAYLRSRMSGGHILEVKGPDMRPVVGRFKT